MELEEMKLLWEDLSEKLERQHLLTDKIIMDMTKERYKNKFRSMVNMESLGTVICYGFAIFILANFSRFDTWYLIVSAVFAVAYLFTIPMLSLRAIFQMQNVNISENDFRQTLIDFTRAKKRFRFITQLGIYLNFVLLVAVLIVTLGIFRDEDPLANSSVWLWMLPFGFLFLVFFSRWGYRCYMSITASAEHLLKELEQSV